MIEDLYLENNRLMIRSYDGSSYKYILYYILYALGIKLCSVNESSKYFLTFYNLCSTLVLVMLNELLLLSNQELLSLLLTIIIITDLFKSMMKWYWLIN